MQALRLAAEQDLPGWCIAAGFVRNLAWDKAHGYPHSTPLNDIDLIYFDDDDIAESRDRDIEKTLRRLSGLPWSVKNQARMHARNGDAPYTSTADAMRYWVEVETAVGAWLDDSGAVASIAPFGVAPLFNLTITLNPQRPKPFALKKRIAEKGWLESWPRLRVIGG